MHRAGIDRFDLAVATAEAAGFRADLWAAMLAVGDVGGCAGTVAAGWLLVASRGRRRTITVGADEHAWLVGREELAIVHRAVIVQVDDEC